MFSITTIASSTTSPVARVRPKSVRVLIEKPSSLTRAKVPTSDTGMVIAGMSVVRQSCRKMKITRMTNRIACTSVISTSRIDSPTTVVVSKATVPLRPGGKRCARRSSSVLIALSTSSALALGSWKTAKPTAGTSPKLRLLSYDSEPSSTVPRSLSLTSVPSFCALTMMLPNSAGSDSRPPTRTLISKPWPGGTGGWPTRPAATSTF